MESEPTADPLPVAKAVTPEPHRGPLLYTAGLLCTVALAPLTFLITAFAGGGKGGVCFLLFLVVAWAVLVACERDLNRMDAGKMDRAGFPQVSAGMTFARVGAALIIAALCTGLAAR